MAVPDAQDRQDDDGSLTYEETVEFVTMLRAALEYGAHCAREFFDTHEGARDEGLRAYLIRWFANAYCRARGELIEFVQQRVNSSGLSFLVAGSHMKVWKAEDGELPRSRTKTRRAFIAQVVQLQLPFLDVLPSPRIHQNIALLWELDRKFNLARLEMVKPKGMKGRQGLYFWRLTIPEITQATDPAMPTGVTTAPAFEDLDEIGFPDVESFPKTEANKPMSQDDD